LRAEDKRLVVSFGIASPESPVMGGLDVAEEGLVEGAGVAGGAVVGLDVEVDVEVAAVVEESKVDNNVLRVTARKVKNVVNMVASDSMSSLPVAS
jgi:hypothetical protein